MKLEATPWRALLGAAAQAGIAPHCFWRLSLREWRALISPTPAEALSRDAFATLAELFPDQSHDAL